MPKVLNKRAIRSLTCEAVYIGHPSKWGNPFAIGRDGSREEVIGKFEAHLLGNPVLMGSMGELRGRDLVCWCAPLACHGDVLLRYANRESDEG